MSQENQDYCYFDIQGLEGMGIIFNGKRVVFTGISVYTENECRPKRRHSFFERKRGKWYSEVMRVFGKDMFSKF